MAVRAGGTREVGWRREGLGIPGSLLISSKDLPAATWLATHRACKAAWSAQKLCLPGFRP